jgi:2-oxoglutarate ferredoxin oxidoreductase subunit alpha
VVIDVMRQGPCQGVATLPAQGDLMQARWGTHGDHPVIALAPCSVAEAYFETIRAFNLAERFRTPVLVLSDASLAHMSEKVGLPEPGSLTIVNRKRPHSPKDKSFKPYADDGSGIAPLASFGDGYRWYVSGIIHDETGFPDTASPEAISGKVKHLLGKIENNRAEIEAWEEYRAEDAELLILAIGLVARSAKAAIDQARLEGKKAGLFRPITLWPFPKRRFAELADPCGKILVCEMNEGQLAGLVAQLSHAKIIPLNQNNGRLITAETILQGVREALT